MREIRLFDPDRTPPSWTDCLRTGEVAVFCLAHDTGIPCSPDGSLGTAKDGTCAVFDNLELAKEHCESLTARNSRVRCEVYGKAGKGAPPLAVFVNAATEKQSAFNRSLWGTWFVVVGIALLLVDWRLKWDSIWPTAAGIKLITIGIIFLLWEPLKRLNRRRP